MKVKLFESFVEERMDLKNCFEFVEDDFKLRVKLQNRYVSNTKKSVSVIIDKILERPDGYIVGTPFKLNLDLIEEVLSSIGKSGEIGWKISGFSINLPNRKIDIKTEEYFKRLKNTWINDIVLIFFRES